MTPTAASAESPAPPGPSPAAAVDDAAVAAVARALNCPICQGRNLLDCPLPVCAEMRAEIRSQLGAGRAPDAVIQHFVDYYGPTVRNTPPLGGLLGLAWWIPIVVVIGGTAAVARLVARRQAAARPAAASAGAASAAASGQAQPAPPPTTPLDPAMARYAAQIERLAADDPDGPATPPPPDAASR